MKPKVKYIYTLLLTLLVLSAKPQVVSSSSSWKLEAIDSLRPILILQSWYTLTTHEKYLGVLLENGDMLRIKAHKKHPGNELYFPLSRKQTKILKYKRCKKIIYYDLVSGQRVYFTRKTPFYIKELIIK